MRHFALSIVAVYLATVAASVFVPAQSQTPTKPAAPCGPVAYSAADQKYSAVPCTAPAATAEAGKPAPCGPGAYSAADQKYTGVPCTAPSQKAEAGKPAPCGPVAHSAADQKYVGVPCTTK